MKTNRIVFMLYLALSLLGTLMACSPSNPVPTVTLVEEAQDTPLPSQPPVTQPAVETPTRLTNQEALKLITSYWLEQKPNLAPNFDLAVEELTTAEQWEQIPVQVFRMTNGIFPNESFLIHDEDVLPMGTAFGGQGVTSITVSDLDQDGVPELLFSYSFGSGIHQTRLGMYAPAHDDKRTNEANLAYLGDLEIRGDKNSPGDVGVFTTDDPQKAVMIGKLAIELRNGQVELALHTVQDLPQVFQDKLRSINTQDSAAYWMEKQDPHFGVRFAIPCFWEVDFPSEYPANGIAYSIRNYSYEYALTIGKNTDEIWENGGVKIDMNFTTGESWNVPPGASLTDFVNQLYGNNPEVQLVSTAEEQINSQVALLVTTESIFGPGQFYVFSINPDTYLMFSPNPESVQDPDVRAILNSITIDPQREIAMPDQAPGQPPVGAEGTCNAR